MTHKQIHRQLKKRLHKKQNHISHRDILLEVDRLETYEQYQQSSHK